MADDDTDSTAADSTLHAEGVEDDAPTGEVEVDGDGDGNDEELPEPSEAKRKADAVIAARRSKDPSVAKEGDDGERKVERRVVTSRRVTPKAGAVSSNAGSDANAAASSKARDAKKTEALLRTTPPTADAVKVKGPSPWWVPALMFGLMVVGAVVIMANYAGAFGDPDNMRLVLGLALILGGIITATQYR